MGLERTERRANLPLTPPSVEQQSVFHSLLFSVAQKVQVKALEEQLHEFEVQREGRLAAEGNLATLKEALEISKGTTQIVCEIAKKEEETAETLEQTARTLEKTADLAKETAEIKKQQLKELKEFNHRYAIANDNLKKEVVKAKQLIKEVQAECDRADALKKISDEVTKVRPADLTTVEGYNKFMRQVEERSQQIKKEMYLADKAQQSLLLPQVTVPPQLIPVPLQQSMDPLPSSQASEKQAEVPVSLPALKVETQLEAKNITRSKQITQLFLGLDFVTEAISSLWHCVIRTMKL